MCFLFFIFCFWRDLEEGNVVMLARWFLVAVSWGGGKAGFLLYFCIVGFLFGFFLSGFL